MACPVLKLRYLAGTGFLYSPKPGGKEDMPIIAIEHLSKAFGPKKVLDDICLQVEKGDIYGVLGLSGAGKSTLVRCLNGLETFDAGRILYKGEILAEPRKRVARKKRREIAMIFQDFNLLDQRTVLQNVRLALDLGHQKDGGKAMECLRRVGLEDKARVYPSQLSGGQKQRVAIARALALDPAVILSDEATSALDPETTDAILDLLKQLAREKGITIIMISHQMNAIERICNKVAIISEAKLVEQGPLAEVFLRPKTAVARSLIYSNQLKAVLDEQRGIRILFNGNEDEPLLANIVQECHILVSVLYADTKVIDGKVYGQLIVKSPAKKAEEEKLTSYLKAKKVDYEEVSSHGLA